MQKRSALGGPCLSEANNLPGECPVSSTSSSGSAAAVRRYCVPNLGERRGECNYSSLVNIITTSPSTLDPPNTT